MKRYFSTITVLFTILSTLYPAMAADKLSLFVSILPQKYFVQQIGKDLVDVRVMVMPGQSPATYEPKPSQMAALSRADLYFAIGVPFEEAWLGKIHATNPDMKIVHTDHGIKKRAMAEHFHETDEHHNAEENDHGVEDHDDDHGVNGHDDDHDGLDPHIWLSPKLVLIQARTMAEALKKADPQNADGYDTGLKDFIRRITELDSELMTLFASRQQMPIMVFHPSWGYFAQSYDLVQIPIEIEGKSPKPAQLRELITHAKENDIQVIFAQPQFSAKSAQLIAREIRGIVVFADPLAENWLENLKNVAQNFYEVPK